MPYTPPGQSPAASPANIRSKPISVYDARSPATSFSSTVMKSNNPPRSATYLYKNRRTLATSPHTPPINTQFLPSRPLSNGSIHKSPAPIDGGLSMLPTGAIFSPPDSSQNSSDEEDSATGTGRGRRRNLGNLELQLKEAIKNIPQRRDSSPDSTDAHKSPSPTDPECKSRRLHQRSASESLLTNFGIRQDSFGSGSDDDDEGYRMAPPMVRKKSGEVVKSSLKTPNRSRPSSMPSTPTFPKAVHFDATIEHVRHFLHSEKPSAVSAGSSPVESYDGETEFPFHNDDDFRLREPPFEWDIALPNFPRDLDSRRHLPVRVERVVLSTDKKNLIGTVAVTNIAFQKSVVVRFTLDFWETVSEVSAEFNPDVRKRQKEDGVDRFTFNIKLVDQANLEKKLLFFCVRYTSGGQEFWDNNSGVNFQVEFKKKPKPQNGKSGSRAPLPRSKPSATRPRSVPSFDELDGYDAAGIFEKLKNAELPEPKSLNITDTTESLARRANPSGNAFGNRYDFGASLNAAIQASEVKKIGPRRKTISFGEVDNSYFKSGGFGSPVPAPAEEKKVQALPAPKPASPTSPPRSARSAVKGNLSPPDSPPSSGSGSPKGYKPVPFLGDKPSIESSSYRELLDNYCFYGSAKASPQLSQGAEFSEKKAHDSSNLNTALFSGAVFTEMGSGSPLPESACPRYAPSPPHTSPPSSLKSSDATSPIPPNYAGFHHRRRASGAFRFGAPAPTAIC